MRPVPVGIDEAGQDGLSGEVDDPRAGRYRNARGRADRRYAVAADDDRPAFDHLVAIHRDDARVGQRDRARRMRFGRDEAEMRDWRRGAGLGGVECRQVEAPAVKVGALRPVERAAVARPVEIIAGVGADLGLRQRLRVRGDVELPPAHEGHDISLISFGPADELLVRRQRELCGVGRLEVRQGVGAGDADRLEQRIIVAVLVDEEHALAVLAELRESPTLRDALGLGAGRQREDVDARVAAPQRCREEAVRSLAISDRPAVGRESGLAIIARLGGDRASGAAGRGDQFDRAALVVVPRDVSDLAPVA